MNRLSPRAQAAADLAVAQRKLCREWLIYIMASSSVKTRTKDDLRAEAIERFKVSKNAFDFAWIDAIEKTGNRHWYGPLRWLDRRVAIHRILESELAPAVHKNRRPLQSRAHQTSGTK